MALFKSYFGGTFDEDAIRNNFVLIYELLDGKGMSYLWTSLAASVFIMDYSFEILTLLTVQRLWTSVILRISHLKS